MSSMPPNDATFQGWRLPPGLATRWEPGLVADLGPGARLAAPGAGHEAARELLTHLAAAGGALARTPVAELARALGSVGARFLDPADPLRLRALALLPGHAGISAAQARHVLDGMARDWTPAALQALVDAEFDDPAVLDGFRPVSLSGQPHRQLRALPLGAGSGVGVHVCAGTVPGVSVTSLLRALLVKSPVLVKPGAGDAVLPVLFLEGLAGAAAHDPCAQAAVDAAAVVWWPGGEGGVFEDAVLAGAGHLVAYGSDETVASLRARLAPGVPVVDYPHRVSVVVVDPSGPGSAGLAHAVALATAAFDQRGCVSPRHCFVVGGMDEAAAFGASLAAAFTAVDTKLPPGPVPADQAAAVQQLRGAAEVREAAGLGVRLHVGAGLGWTIVVEDAPSTLAPCLARTLVVSPVGRGGDAVMCVVQALDPLRTHLQTVGIGGLDATLAAGMAEALARLGASRIEGVDDVAFPRPWWHHDGQGPLRRLVRWSSFDCRGF